MPDLHSRLPGLEPNPGWYRNAVIYELHVRAFQDSDSNGTGDFRGLTTRLDYLRDLGVTALWLLPFYPSPLKDDGYDIADYCNVHPNYGTLADFKIFLREAHRRGLRVITELVLNHTSDQHPWFQRARRSKPGSRWRDFYVWNNNPDKYKGTRVIFKDTEISNWSWDPVANAYFWHRFYSHQPDLNYDHPPVHREMFKAIDFWFKLGVDGLRLDAVPYLYQREGTSCENLPETHAFLKAVRKHVDSRYRDRMLLAEANQWPEDAIAYFGEGDECHMAFHFPLMPRLFMALRMEDRVPIVDILHQTPPLPNNAQWALFLRNHDELTLEMVTDEERDYMYRMYAQTHLARLNLGIRRRLAPLLGNDRRRIELLNALLFSLPGSPVLYYGDEIGMGENIYLGDRNGVRTPMQWSADRNAGFSRANPQSLYLPINFDPENHYEAVNVDVQQRNPHSLLWWMKRLVALRKRWVGLGLGSLEFLHPENRKIIAFIRRHEDQSILVVANLSRFVQPVELDLAQSQGLVPVELFGRNEFPPITDRPYFLTLSPHAFFWFSLEPKAPDAADVTTATPPSAAPVSVHNDWEEIFRDPRRAQLEDALQHYLPGRRWFGGKAKTIKSVHLHDVIPIPIQPHRAALTIVQVDYLQSEPDFYLLPLAFATDARAESLLQDAPGLVLLRLKLARPQTVGVVFDATADRTFCRTLLDLIARRRSLKGRLGDLDSSYTPFLRQLREAGQLDLEPAPTRAEQSNSSIVFGDRLILKFLRRLEPGVNPELDIGRHLAARRFAHTPPLAGALEYRTPKHELMSLAVLSSFVPGCKDAWSYTLDTLGSFYERVQTFPPEQRLAPPIEGSLMQKAETEIPQEPLDFLSIYAESARLLGQRTAALHLTLANAGEDPDFLPEPFTPHYQRALYQSMRNLTRHNYHLLARRLKHLPESIATKAQSILNRESELLTRFRTICDRRLTATRIRVHGDYHLGQVLYTGKDFLIIDFEGEPARSLGERRLKRSPLSDVAGMIRSFHYAAHAALLQQTERGTLPADTAGPAATWAQYWFHWVSVIFLRAYAQTAAPGSFLPDTEEERRVITDVYLLEKAVYELGYELNNRPQWLSIPLRGIQQLLDS